MEEQNQNLEQLCKSISNKIIDSKNIAELLFESIDLDKHAGTIVLIITKNLKNAFNEIEICRKFISNPN